MSLVAFQEHPDTVGGAMLTGVREAVRVLRMLKGDTEEEANAAAGAVDAGLPSRKRKQVCSCCLSTSASLLTNWLAVTVQHCNLPITPLTIGFG